MVSSKNLLVVGSPSAGAPFTRFPNPNPPPTRACSAVLDVIEMVVVVVGGGVGRRKAWPTCGRRRRRLQMMIRKRREEEEEREERRLGIFTERKERGLYYARVGKGREGVRQ